MIKPFLLMFWFNCFVGTPLKAAIYSVTYNVEIIEYQRIETAFDPFSALLEAVQVTETWFTIAEFEIQTTFEQNEKESRCLNVSGSLGANWIRVDDRSHLPNATLEATHIINHNNTKKIDFQLDFKATLPHNGFSLQLTGGNPPFLKLKSYKQLQQCVGFIQLIWEESSQSIFQQLPSTTRMDTLPTDNNILNYSLRVKRNKKLLIL